MITAREFTDARELRAHYAALRAKTFPQARPVARVARVTRQCEPEPIIVAPVAPPPTSHVLPEALRPKARIREIQWECAVAEGLIRDDIMGKSHRPRIVRARRAAICQVRQEFPAMSLTAIGKAFGMDHTSILHALQKAGVWVRQGPRQ